MTKISDSSSPPATDTELAKMRFNLSDIYAGVRDPRISEDLDDYARRTDAIRINYRGKLAELPPSGNRSCLGNALKELEEAYQVANKIWCFTLLSYSCNQADDALKALRSKVEERFAQCAADNLTFMDIEICKIDADLVERIAAADPRVRFCLPYLGKIRRFQKHKLSEEVERALTLREPFGPSAVSNFIEQQMSGLQILIDDGVSGIQPRPFQGALKYLSSPNRVLRAAAQREINKTLGEKIVPVAALGLNLMAGMKAVEDAERSYRSPIEARNISNQISPKAVEALHSAVQFKAKPIAARYYKLLAKQLGLSKLAWSDRLAPLSSSEQEITWKEAISTVIEAYQSFSPTLAKLIKEMVDNGRIDAPTYLNKQTGAYSLSVDLPPPLGPRSYNLLNFTGRLQDIRVIAHELGHAVHGILAGQAQGALMSHPPIAYAETASVFGEMVTYESILRSVKAPRERLVLLMGKLGDFMNTVVRQISFSAFEQMVHTKRRVGVLSETEISEIWITVTHEFYGAPGDVFDYIDMQNMWSYILHFHDPFYVYGYAFGELLTQSLYAEREAIGDRFEPLYLDMLRAGATKDAVELLKPFGLNPEDPRFWERGIAASAERWVKLAEELAAGSGQNA